MLLLRYLPGEDPYLGTALTPPFVAGVQAEKVAVCAKHFLLNTQETYRNTMSTDADDRTWQEVYARPFAAAIQAGAVAMMCGYNQVNGSQACGAPRLLNGLVRDTLGFEGFVMSDW